MHLIFCSDPFDGRQPDTDYLREVAAVKDQGGSYGLISFEALVNEGDPERAVRRVAAAETQETAIYRGWMLTPEQYALLYKALLSRNYLLVNSPEQYLHCHYLPESYPAIEKYTPRSVWLTKSSGLAMDDILAAVKPFGASPLVLKDYVKSQKHHWNEACFIPSASDREVVERVVNRFIELQGDDLQGGLVFREYVELEPLTTHPRSGMPLTKEFRIFFFDGQSIFSTQYWDEGEYGNTELPIERFRAVAANVKSRFFTMDIAEHKDGEWIIVELGDGQVAGLPKGADADAFYGALLGRGL